MNPIFPLIASLLIICPTHNKVDKQQENALRGAMLGAVKALAGSTTPRQLEFMTKLLR